MIYFREFKLNVNDSGAIGIRARSSSSHPLLWEVLHSTSSAVAPSGKVEVWQKASEKLTAVPYWFLPSPSMTALTTPLRVSDKLSSGVGSIIDGVPIVDLYKLSLFPYQGSETIQWLWFQTPRQVHQSNSETIPLGFTQVWIRRRIPLPTK